MVDPLGIVVVLVVAVVAVVAVARACEDLGLGRGPWFELWVLPL